MKNEAIAETHELTQVKSAMMKGGSDPAPAAGMVIEPVTRVLIIDSDSERENLIRETLKKEYGDLNISAIRYASRITAILESEKYLLEQDKAKVLVIDNIYATPGQLGDISVRNVDSQEERKQYSGIENGFRGVLQRAFAAAPAAGETTALTIGEDELKLHKLVDEFIAEYGPYTMRFSNRADIEEFQENIAKGHMMTQGGQHIDSTDYATLIETAFLMVSVSYFADVPTARGISIANDRILQLARQIKDQKLAELTALSKTNTITTGLTVLVISDVLNENNTADLKINAPIRKALRDELSDKDKVEWMYVTDSTSDEAIIEAAKTAQRVIWRISEDNPRRQSIMEKLLNPDIVTASKLDLTSVPNKDIAIRKFLRTQA